MSRIYMLIAAVLFCALSAVPASAAWPATSTWSPSNQIAPGATHRITWDSTTSPGDVSPHLALNNVGDMRVTFETGGGSAESEVLGCRSATDEATCFIVAKFIGDEAGRPVSAPGLHIRVRATGTGPAGGEQPRISIYANPAAVEIQSEAGLLTAAYSRMTFDPGEDPLGTKPRPDAVSPWFNWRLSTTASDLVWSDEPSYTHATLPACNAGSEGVVRAITNGVRIGNTTLTRCADGGASTSPAICVCDGTAYKTASDSVVTMTSVGSPTLEAGHGISPPAAHAPLGTVVVDVTGNSSVSPQCVDYQAIGGVDSRYQFSNYGNASWFYSFYIRQWQPGALDKTQNAAFWGMVVRAGASAVFDPLTLTLSQQGVGIAIVDGLVYLVTRRNGDSYSKQIADWSNPTQDVDPGQRAFTFLLHTYIRFANNSNAGDSFVEAVWKEGNPALTTAGVSSGIGPFNWLGGAVNNAIIGGTSAVNNFDPDPTTNKLPSVALLVPTISVCGSPTGTSRTSYEAQLGMWQGNDGDFE